VLVKGGASPPLCLPPLRETAGLANSPHILESAFEWRLWIWRLATGVSYACLGTSFAIGSIIFTDSHFGAIETGSLVKTKEKGKRLIPHIFLKSAQKCQKKFKVTKPSQGRLPNSPREGYQTFDPSTNEKKAKKVNDNDNDSVS
jgi:hypothetical protein